jgi:hypothetical protein
MGQGKGEGTGSGLPRSWAMSLEALRATSFLLATLVLVLISRTGIVVLMEESKTVWCWRIGDSGMDGRTWGRGSLIGGQCPAGFYLIRIGFRVQGATF